MNRNSAQQSAPQSFDQRWTAWGSAYGGGASYNGNAAIGSNNLGASDFGFAGGMDYHAAPDLKLGFALAGGGTNWSLAQNLGGGKSDALQVAGYGIKHYGPLYFTAMAALGNSWFTTNQTAAFGDQLRATFEGQSYGLRGESGYRFAMTPTSGITPYAAVQTQWFHTPGYSETDLTGGGFGLTYNAQTANDTRSELGARADDLMTLDNMPLILRARVAWAHDWVSNTALGAVFQTLPGASFTVNGAAVPANSALLSAGGQLFFSPNWSVEAKFDSELASSAQTYAGTGTLSYTWRGGLSRLGPKLRRSAARAFGERLQFEPDDLAVDLNAAGKGAETAIHPGDDVFAPNRTGEVQDAVGDDFRMLHRIDRRIDNAGHDDFAWRQLHLAPDFPFMLMAGVGGGKRHGQRLGGEH
ncbi:MAG: autotransporter outer membrane beta-barrel domain-containing protein, partial [Xanthobacteraceae bacterium]